MFNREIRVNFVKKNKTETTNEPTEITIEDTVNAVNVVFDNMVRKVAMAALGYVIIDTGRKILVAKASN